MKRIVKEETRRKIEHILIEQADSLRLVIEDATQVEGDVIIKFVPKHDKEIEATSLYT